MKTFPRLFLVLAVLAILITACAPAVQGLVSLPDDAQQLILALVTAGLTWLLLQLSTLLKIDFSGYAQPLAAVIAPIIITFIESYLQLIPPVFDELVLSIIHVLVLLVSSVGTYIVFLKTKSKQTKRLLV